LAVGLSGATRPALRRVRLGATGTAAERSPPTAMLIAAAVPIGFLLLSPSLSGHASTQSPSAVLLPANVLHVAAMSVWLGGLAALAVALPAATGRLEPDERTRLLSSAMIRFSPLALAAVIALAVTGTVQAVIEVGSVDALFDTAFGRAVAIKVVLLVVLIALGAANRRRLIPALKRLAARGESPGGPGRGARRNLRAEVVLIGVVLAVTAALVSYAPASESDAGPVSGRTQFGDALLEYTVDPAQVGRNEIHIYLFDAEDGSQLERVRGLELALSLPEEDIGPIDADLRKAGPGHYVATSTPFGVAGDWTLDASMRVSRFEDANVELEVPIE
jgi:copper transport protein